MRNKSGSESDGNLVEVFKGGAPFFDKLFGLIDSAEHFIHIQVYILANDSTGNRLLEGLFKAAQRGVSVYFILDAFGSFWVNQHHLNVWKKKGIHVKLFSRMLRFKHFFLSRRQHAKIVIIDNRWMSVGGLNFANRYSGMDGMAPWLDAVCWVKGPAAAQLNALSSVYWPRKIRKHLRSWPAASAESGGINVRILNNDWLRNRFEIGKAYFKAIESAQHEIFIIAAYFFPSRLLLRLLRQKAKEGVKIKLFFSAVSDVPFVKPATEYFYAALRREGIEIWEWKKSVLHAKMAFVDSSWLTLGSYNLNQLSDFGSLETNIAFQNPQMVSEFQESFQEYIYPDSEMVSHVSSGVLWRFSRFLSFLLIRFALKLLFLTNPANK